MSDSRIVWWAGPHPSLQFEQSSDFMRRKVLECREESDNAASLDLRASWAKMADTFEKIADDLESKLP